jgi:hypothetical protein
LLWVPILLITPPVTIYNGKVHNYDTSHQTLDTWLNYRDDLYPKWLEFDSEGVAVLVQSSLTRIAEEQVIIRRDYYPQVLAPSTYYTLPKGNLKGKQKE